MRVFVLFLEFWKDKCRSPIGSVIKQKDGEMKMSKFRCKRCNRMVEVTSENEQKCIHCGTMHEYVYGKTGWGFELSGYRTRKCVYCKETLYIPASEQKEKVKMEMCSNCGRQNAVVWEWYDVKVLPYDTAVEKCVWCNEVIEIDISSVMKQWIELQEGQRWKSIITCQHCKRSFEFF